MKGGLAAFLAILAALTATSSQQGLAQSGDVIEDPDVYAVYASVFPPGFRTDARDERPLAILQETTPLRQIDCIARSLSRFGEEWQPVFESYKSENSRTQTLRAGFLEAPYMLVASSAVENQPSGQPERTFYNQFRNGDLLAVSAVGFDQTKTHALVTVLHNSGFNGQNGETFLLERKDGARWIVAPEGTVCVWIT